jgi:molecular chaperone DnaK
MQVAERTLRDAGVRVPEVGEVLLVGGQTRMPRIQQAVRDLFGREPSKSVHPEEVVALGAALQAQLLVAPESAGADVLLLDVTPQNLGIVVAGGWFQTVIPRNTTIPTTQRHIFTTSQDDQTSVRISVLQGERERASENELLGEFVMGGIRPAPRGEVEIEVTFEISADGIVGVAAKDIGTGARQSIVVTATSGLSAAELERILDEHRDELLAKRQVRGENEARRGALEAAVREIEALAPAAEDALRRSRFGGDAVERARAAIARARAAIDAGDPEALSVEEQRVDRTLQLFRSLAAGRVPGEGTP